MKAFAAAVCLMLAAGTAAAQAPPIVGTLSGHARVASAGQLIILDTPVRLFGIATPSGDAAAMVALHRLVDSRILICHLMAPRPGDAPADRLAGCEAGGLDIGAQLVEGGHALDCPAMSRGRYKPQEERARNAGRDLASRFPLPPSCAAAPVRRRS